MEIAEELQQQINDIPRINEEIAEISKALSEVSVGTKTTMTSIQLDNTIDGVKSH